MFIAWRLDAPGSVRSDVRGWSDADLDGTGRRNSSHSYKHCAPDGAGSVQPSAGSSLQRLNIQVKNAVDSLIARLSSLTLGLRGKKGSVFTDT